MAPRGLLVLALTVHVMLHFTTAKHILFVEQWSPPHPMPITSSSASSTPNTSSSFFHCICASLPPAHCDVHFALTNCVCKSHAASANNETSIQETHVEISKLVTDAAAAMESLSLWLWQDSPDLAVRLSHALASECPLHVNSLHISRCMFSDKPINEEGGAYNTEGAVGGDCTKTEENGSGGCVLMLQGLREVCADFHTDDDGAVRSCLLLRGNIYEDPNEYANVNVGHNDNVADKRGIFGIHANNDVNHEARENTVNSGEVEMALVLLSLPAIPPGLRAVTLPLNGDTYAQVMPCLDHAKNCVSSEKILLTLIY
ncbi:uncharacterized protein LOC133350414 [Lethenteron reissneri]|uniref:uncharacterized protein LOC133350414 n=1 Tax=Lethenteron reissneri TaxID=7753 RepID=UPI002AB639C4|nr:uncharacterized protein LOC133350414 [Lethenteron reissneri]